MDARCFWFGPFALIPSRQALLRNGTPVRLGARALEILTVLVERPGAVIDKNEIMSLVWSDRFVDDSNLKVHIAALRRVLDDEASQSSCIATVIGIGYRFVEPVLDSELSRSTALSGLNNPLRCAELLVGGEEIIDRLRTQVEGNRLVNIVGSADVGKTAVAIAVAERLKSLGAALDMSFDSLPSNERLVLFRLASIEGCFDLDEAILTVSDQAMGRAETAACIANLVSKSLVEREGYRSVSFRLLNWVRYYASRKLAAHLLRTKHLVHGEGSEATPLDELVRDEPARERRGCQSWVCLE